MFELKGKYASAKVFTDVVEQEAIAQVVNLLNQPYTAGQIIRMMPDIHAGAGCTIGTTMTIQDCVCPNLVGVDIGCGMRVLRLSADSKMDFKKLDDALHGYNGTAAIVPSGFEIRNSRHVLSRSIALEELHCANQVNIERAYLSIGTLGGGNHFIEVDTDKNGRNYLVIHTGSRHLGIDVCKYYQTAAAKALSGPSKDEKEKLIASLKAQGRQSEIGEALKKLSNDTPSVPADLAWCSGKMFDSYIHDMKIAQFYAVLNRAAIASTICGNMNWAVEEAFETIHNYIDTRAMILRKGAVSAQAGEKLLIPMNMRDGSLLCVGKGCPDWNYSAPHGAGRLMSRSKAKEVLSIDEFKETMQDVFTTSVGAGTLDESPMAYKHMEDIVNNIGDTVDVVDVLKPAYNFKASE